MCFVPELVRSLIPTCHRNRHSHERAYVLVVLLIGSQELARRKSQLQHNINEIPVPLFLHVAKTGGE